MTMPSSSGRPPDLRLVVAALGVTQVTGYGTLYYGLGVLAPILAPDFGWTKESAFGILSASFLAGGLVAPLAGRLTDRHGAGRLMSVGSVASALSLAICAWSPSPLIYIAGLLAAGVASSFVLYGLAFAALVQIAPRHGQRNITYLTLIAGFASTLFWPMTAGLAAAISWRAIYGLFAAANILLCLPLHLWLSRLTRPKPIALQSLRDAGSPTPADEMRAAADLVATGLVPPHQRRHAFLLTILTLAFFSFVNSAMLIHMLPILTDLGLGLAGVWISALFGPAQVVSRLGSILLGRDIAASTLALISASFLPAALALLVVTAPSVPAAVVFMMLFGVATGLNSIVQGTLTLLLFGSVGYGARLGRLTAVRLVFAAVAPFGFSLMSAQFGVRPALVTLVLFGLGSLTASILIVSLLRQRTRSTGPA